MKIVVVQLPEFLHEYLLEVQRRHAHAGLEPEELTVSAQLWEATTKKAVVMNTDAATNTSQPAVPVEAGEPDGSEQPQRPPE
jgi:hypothetical protein